MKWTVWIPQRPARYAERGLGSEVDSQNIEADECYDSPSGVLKFLNYVQAPEPEKIDLCGHAINANGKTYVSCVRESGHSGKHMIKLKGKPVKRRTYPVRIFAHGSWSDVEIVK